jgi:membrane protease YdiL (CAAX protease family)
MTTLLDAPGRYHAYLKNSRLAVFIEVALVFLFIFAWALFKLPATVIPMLAIAWASLRLRGMKWKDVGLTIPGDWPVIAAGGIVIGIVAMAINVFALTPFLTRATGSTVDLSSITFVKSNILNLMAGLGFIWVLAALAEEMVYRGYIMNRLADLAGHGFTGDALALAVSALLFTIVHARPDAASMIGLFFAGLFDGFLYLAARRNLMLPIVVHGIMDSIALFMVFLGIIT